MNLTTKEIYITDIITGNGKNPTADRNEVRFNMTWKCTQPKPDLASIKSSVTVGFNHSHPFSSGPSPVDIFPGADSYI